MGLNDKQNPPQEVSAENLGKSLKTFLTIAAPPVKMHQAIKALVLQADCTKLDEDYRQTILLWQDYLEEQNL